MKLNVIDLFAGAGGMSYGFQMAGCRVLFGIDCDKDSARTFLQNHQKSEYLVKDIEKVDEKEIKKLLNGRNADIVIGGPPCQGFSISGKRISSDPRNQLYRHFFRIVDMLKPKAVVIENVPGLKGLYGSKIFNDMLDQFKKRDYDVSWKVLSADKFGVPQARKRLFIVGTKSGSFYFPNERNHEITLWDAISDLPLLEKELESNSYASPPKNRYQELMRKNSSILNNHLATKHTERTKKIISLVPEGKNYKVLPKHLQDTRKVHIAWTRLDGRKPSLTIDTGHRHHFHPKTNRIPTVRESARIQSFPDHYIFFGSKSSQYSQVGNAVAPLLAFELAKQLTSSLHEEHV